MVGLVVTGTAACALCRCATELFFVQTVFYFQALCETICFQINFETKKQIALCGKITILYFTFYVAGRFSLQTLEHPNQYSMRGEGPYMSGKAYHN